MIIDHLAFANSKLYSPILNECIKYLKDLDPSTPDGAYPIVPGAEAHISTYTTLETNTNGFEAHNKHVDIQCLLSGQEHIRCTMRGYYHEDVEYHEDRDYMFFPEKNFAETDIQLEPGMFAIFFPGDAHMPQLAINEPMQVRKVVVKVEVDKL